MTEQERWLPIPGWEGLYSVSNLGRVRSETARGQWEAGRILRLSRVGSSRHLGVSLCRNGSQFSMRVHRLVMLAFVGPCPDGMEVCHNNGDHMDNRLVNLRYDTHLANSLDCHRYGGRAPGQRLSLEQVAEIRHRLAAGESCTSIARDYGVRREAITKIKYGRSWRHRLDQELVNHPEFPDGSLPQSG